METLIENFPGLASLPYILPFVLYFFAYCWINQKVTQRTWSSKAFIPLIGVGLILVVVLVKFAVL